METLIFSAFPGTGKSYFFRHANENNILTEDGECICADSDSSYFSKLPNGEKNPNFIQDYITHIKSLIGKREIIFVSSHKDVREALCDEGIEFILVFPDIEDKDIYIERYRERGSPQAFIDLISDNWTAWITELSEFDKEHKHALHLQLEKGTYLSDILM